MWLKKKKKKKTEKKEAPDSQDFPPGNRYPKFSGCSTSTEVSAPSLCWPRTHPVLPKLHTGPQFCQEAGYYSGSSITTKVKPSYYIVTLLLHAVYKIVIYFKINILFISLCYNKIHSLYNIVFATYTKR